MDNSNRLLNRDISSNTAYAENKIKFKMHNGVLTGNIIDGEIDVLACDEDSLSFDCSENSMYIPLV